jgi:hypothetical protein
MMPGPDPAAFPSLIRRVRRRLWAVRAAESALVGLTVGLCAGIAALAVGWFAPDFPRLITAAGLTIAGAGTGLAVGLRRRPTLWQAAAELDRRAGLAASLATAAELSGTAHPFAEAVCREALTAYSARSAGEVPLRSVPRCWDRAAVVAATLGGLAALLPPGLLIGGTASAGPGDGAGLDAHVRSLSTAGPSGAPTPEAVREAIEKLKAAGRTLGKPDVDPETAKFELARLDDALRKALSELPGEPLTDQERAAWDRALQRARREVMRREAALAGGASPKADTKTDAKTADGPKPPEPGGAGTGPDGTGASATAGSGGVSPGGAPRPPERPPVHRPDDYRDLWREASARSGVVDEAEFPADYRDLVRRF